MRITTMKLTLALSGALFLTAAGVAHAQGDQAQPGQPSMGQGSVGGRTSETIHTAATVQSIDKKTRTVMLKKEDGEVVPIQVPPDSPNFDKLKVGDKVDVDYHEAVAVALLPPGSGKPSATERVTESRGMGKGGVSKETTVSAEVVAVDPVANTVTFKGPRGQLKKVNVTDPDMQAKLKQVKVGQMLQITYSEAIAATIRPSKSSGKME